MGFYSNAGQNVASTESSDIAKLGGAIGGIVHAAMKEQSGDKSSEMYDKSMNEMSKKTSAMNRQRTEFDKRREVIMSFPNNEVGGVNNG